MGARPKDLDPSHGRGLYGSELRRYRLEAGLTLDALATELRYSKGHLSDIERAVKPVPRGLSELLDAFFKTDGHFLRLWPAARRDGHAHPDKYAAFMTHEEKAKRLAEYAAHVIPGLLQTADYARALLRAFKPRAGDDEIEDLVAGRLARQARLHGDEPPSYWVILDEAVIRRPIGGSAVMVAQLEALLPLVEGKFTRIQVLPYNRGAHPALGGSLTLLTLPDRSTVAYLEGSDSGQLIEDPDDVAARQETYDHLRAYALSPGESAAMITTAIEEFRSWVPPT
ncbi:helix-turn-helix domain-containing protein [Streptomycetaceae bacterium NBC_01309]